jgi:hypothetical protein
MDLLLFDKGYPMNIIVTAGESREGGCRWG